MVGAGVFAVWAPAADAAGTGLLIGLGLAAVVAFGNATSSAQLAAGRFGCGAPGSGVTDDATDSALDVLPIVSGSSTFGGGANAFVGAGAVIAETRGASPGAAIINASSVGARIVNGPSASSVLVSPAASIAFQNVPNFPALCVTSSAFRVSGIITLSIEWITPLLHLVSGVTILLASTTSPFFAFTVNRCPFSVVPNVVFEISAASMLPLTT